MLKEELTKGLSMSYGIEKAGEILNEILNKTSLQNKDTYSKEEVFQICDEMETLDNKLVKSLAKIIKTKARFLTE